MKTSCNNCKIQLHRGARGTQRPSSAPIGPTISITLMSTGVLIGPIKFIVISLSDVSTVPIILKPLCLWIFLLDHSSCFLSSLVIPIGPISLRTFLCMSNLIWPFNSTVLPSLSDLIVTLNLIVEFPSSDLIGPLDSIIPPPPSDPIGQTRLIVHTTSSNLLGLYSSIVLPSLSNPIGHIEFIF